jgi:hypothetical protein
MADANVAVVEVRSDRLVRVEWASRSGNSSKGMLSTAYGILGEVRQNWIEAELGAGNRSRYRK